MRGQLYSIPKTVEFNEYFSYQVEIKIQKQQMN